MRDRALGLAAEHRGHPDVRPHPRPARPADHVRVQGGRVGRGARPAPGAARGRAAAAGRSSSSAARSARWSSGVTAPWTCSTRSPGRLGLGAPDDRRGSPRGTASPSSPGCSRRSPRTLGKIGNEVYQLQRPEIGELRRDVHPGHGRLASPCRTSATRRSPSTSSPWPGSSGPRPGSPWRAWWSSTSGTGAAWKAEWLVVPEACHVLRGLRGAWAPGCSRACAWTRSGCARNIARPPRLPAVRAGDARARRAGRQAHRARRPCTRPR